MIPANFKLPLECTSPVGDLSIHEGPGLENAPQALSMCQTGDPVLRGKVPSCAPLAAGLGLASRQSFRVWPGHSETLCIHELKAGVI